MSQALYRKYRSKTLDEIVGQDHVTNILGRAIKAGRISHAYLLTGPRGVGKTSIARILAHEINHLPYDEDATNLDIIEIDAASNNGVEDVRDLREKVQLAPVSASKKIYIIDEVHMLSKAAFNALLKTLEEPPEHVVFILATTDVQKLPATIISRTQQFSFRSITPADAIKQLRKIADAEKIVIDDEALAIIAERGEGSFRDSISLLDQLSSLAMGKKGITGDLIEQTLGLAPRSLVNELLSAIESRDMNEIVKLLDGSASSGINPTVLAAQLTASIRINLAEKPQQLTLLDGLMDVAKSSQPSIKLLTVLAAGAMPKAITKTAALSSPVREVAASVATLKKQEKTDTPHQSRSDKMSQDTKSEVQPFLEERSGILNDSSRKDDNKNDETEEPLIAKLAALADFDWSKVLQGVHERHIPLHSVLAKCAYELTGSTLTIYATNKFYKNKLDDPKYAIILSTCLQELGFPELDIHTIPTTPPPTDKQAAAVAVIMGGGEEVSIESDGN
jgi:DNA polymerase-3 subunit gamma/tau